MAGKAQVRRETLLSMLRGATAPLAGGTLAEQLGVSRQIIVQDIALLREANANIVSTTKGYVLADELVPDTESAANAHATASKTPDDEPFSRTFKVHHSVAQTQDELQTIIAAGGRVKNVSISHRAYGRVTAPLNIATAEDIARFMSDIESGKSSPLCTATSGYHYHLVAADSAEAVEAVGQALAEKGYLAPLLPHEEKEFAPAH